MGQNSIEEQQQDWRIPESSPRLKKGQIVESPGNKIIVTKAGQWIGMALCTAVLAAGALEQLISNRPANAGTLAPDWLPFAAAVIAAAGIMRWNGHPQWLHVLQALRWSGLFLMIWVANGLLFDFLAMAGLIGDPATGLRIGVDWPAMATRSFALAVAVFLASITLARPVTMASTRSAAWYGYAAFVLALPYPVLRIWWALGGTPGLISPGAAGHGLAPILLTIPWLLAAALSLLLVSPRRWKPRRLLLAAGWSATAIVASIAPAACWSLITRLATGDQTGQKGMAIWVFCLFYSSWLLWAIAAGAATRSYQLRSARSDVTGV